LIKLASHKRLFGCYGQQLEQFTTQKTQEYGNLQERKNMRLWCWKATTLDSNQLDIELANEAAGTGSTAGWPDPITPILPTPPPFAAPFHRPYKEYKAFRKAYNAKVSLFRE